METVVQKPGIFSRPQRTILIIMAIVAIWAFSPISPVTVALLAVAALFFFGLKRPVWAVAALLVSQFTVTSYMLGIPLGFSISLRLLLLILTGLVLWRSFAQRQIELGPKARLLLIPALVLLSVSVVANMVNSGFDFAFRDFRNTAVGLMIIIFLPAVTRNLKELKILCGVVFIFVTASAIIGLLQHYQFMGMDGATIIPNFLKGESRVPGMAETELEFAYILSTAVLALLGIYLVRGVNSGTKRLLVFSMLLMAPALYFTYTRSALLALVLGLVALALFLKTRMKGEYIMAALLLAVAFIEVTGIMGGQYLGGRAEGVQEESTVARQILWQAGVAIAMDNPILGIGGDQYKNVSPRYASSVDSSLLSWEKSQYWGYTTLGNEEIHNDFLKVWVSYGTLALVAYLWLFVVILRNFLDSYHMSKRRFIKGLSIGLAAALVAYGVNAFYHNLMTTMPLFWILAGFSLTTAKLAREKTRPQVKMVDRSEERE
jgi:putative inorganic carbon (HCO3(-)) transporter